MRGIRTRRSPPSWRSVRSPGWTGRCCAARSTPCSRISASRRPARLGAIVPQDWTQAVATLSTVGLISADAQAASFYEPGLVHAERYDSLVQP